MSLSAAASLGRRAVVEGVGTAFLVAVVVGSGIMGERLAPGNGALILLANSLATGAGLCALILALGPISGAHLNPAITLASGLRGELRFPDVAAYLVAQLGGGFAGVLVAHAMFGLPLVAASHHVRAGAPQLVSEAVATFGLATIVLGCARRSSDAVAFAVAGYITAGYWFTASTCFANPAVTLARAATDSFTGIRLVDVPSFVVVELAGAAAAALLFRWIGSPSPKLAQPAVTP